MARILGCSEGFKNDSQLQRYYLDGVKPTGNTLGVGSYGSVVEVLYRQVSCAAKCMHELLLDVRNEGVQDAIDKYRRECQLMAGLRHPNITQFLGLCFLEGSELPLLVMEKLEMSVDDLLKCAPNIPLPVKLSILTDTCSGLVYLHGMPSPIVHRDLTARNILLTSSLAAKITDMGNSRIANLRPVQLVQTMSKVPGTLVYMPPEALNDSHRYGPSLDVFSFGHLALYILTQLFPEDLLSATHVDQHNPGRVIGRTEVERREVYMKKLEYQFIDSHRILVELVTNCLHNNPQTRPSSEQLLERLLPLKKEMNLTYGGTLVNVTHVLHIKEIKEKDKIIKQLETNESRLESEKRSLEIENSQLKSEKQYLQREIDPLNKEQQRTNTSIENKKLLKKKLPTCSLKLDWRRGPDMPVAMTDFIQSVEINGTLYVGGGYTDRSEDRYIVMAYSMQSSQWQILPQYTTRAFAMTTIYGKLVLVGGVAKDSRSDSSELGEWQPDSNQWSHPFPPMPTPRSQPSATSYKHWLVVAGGSCHINRLQSVEVLDVSNMQWLTMQSTPTGWRGMKSAILGDILYIMGGYCDHQGCFSDVYSVSLEALVSPSASDSSNIWKKLPSLDSKLSCPLIIGGSLLAVGGQCIMESEQPVSTIQYHVPETNTWVQAGLLPHAVYGCTCIVTSDKVHVIGGNDGKTKLKHIFTCDKL